MILTARTKDSHRQRLATPETYRRKETRKRRLARGTKHGSPDPTTNTPRRKEEVKNHPLELIHLIRQVHRKRNLLPLNVGK
jgi:hypothetical protein